MFDAFVSYSHLHYKTNHMSRKLTNRNLYTLVFEVVQVVVTTLYPYHGYTCLLVAPAAAKVRGLSDSWARHKPYCGYKDNGNGTRDRISASRIRQWKKRREEHITAVAMWVVVQWHTVSLNVRTMTAKKTASLLPTVAARRLNKLLTISVLYSSAL